ncbi:MAG: ABC transporter permease [Desulfobacteraceae bacterium]|nr:ABC transporter permease [Desulfobacteraceae bacterium]
MNKNSVRRCTGFFDMNKNSVRRCTGLLLHYLREFAAHFGKSSEATGFAILIIVCLYWGFGMVSFLERTGYLKNAGAVESFLEMTVTATAVSLILFTLMYMAAFYDRNQRQEMLNVFTWPAEREIFALLKLLDAYINLLFGIVLLLPGLTAAYANCGSLADVLRITASFGLLCCHVLASYIIAGLLMSLAGAVYIHIPSRKPRFPLFLLLWLMAGLWLITFGYTPFQGCEQHIRMVGSAWVNFWRGLLCTEVKGPIIVIGVSGVGLLILLRVALTVIGICYVENIQLLEDAIMAAQKSIAAKLGRIRLRYLPLISKPVQSLYFKDLKIVTRQYTTVIAVFILVLVSIYFGTRIFMNQSKENIFLAALDTVSLLAVFGTSIFQMFSLPMLGIEGKEGESLVPYPVRARQILLGKTLCVVSLHLPLFILYIASIVYSGFPSERVGSFLLWICWLFPLTLTYIALGGWLKVLPDNPYGKGYAASFLQLPVIIGFIALYYLVLVFAKSVHWLFYPAGCLGCLGLYYVIAGQAVRILPGLRLWNDKAKKDRTETFGAVIRTDIFKICLAAIPVFLVYFYISAGFRPLRYFPADLRSVFYIVPLLVALVLFKIRTSRWSRCILAGSLLFVMAGAVVLRQSDYGLTFEHILSYPEKIDNYQPNTSDTDEEYEVRLPEQVANRFGYDPAMTMDEIYQTPPPSSEHLTEFLTALNDSGVISETRDYDGLSKWLADPASNMPVPEKLDIWLNSKFNKNNLSYQILIGRIFFHRREDWTSDALYLFADRMFRKLNTGRFRKIFINLDMLPFESLNETETRKLAQIFRDEVSNKSSFAKKLDPALQSYAQDFEISSSSPICLQILSRLPGPDAFDTMQELLHKNQTSSGVRMPSFEKLITGKRKPRLRRLKRLWQEYPEYAAFLSVRHPYLSENIIAVNAMPRFTKTSKDIREWIEKTVSIRNREGEITKYIELSGGASAFHGKVIEASTLLCVAIPKSPGLLTGLKPNTKEMTEICRCISEPLHLEDARLLISVVKGSPQNFALEKISWSNLLHKVQLDEYVDFGVTLLSNGAFFDSIVPLTVTYNSSRDNPEYQLIESLNEQLSGLRWHGSLRLHRQYSRLLYPPYVLLLKYKGKDSALSFLRTVGPPFQKDIRVLTDVLTHGEDIDISSVYDYWVESGGYSSIFIQEALIRALLEKGEKDEAQLLGGDLLAHVWDFSEKPGKKISGGFFLTALGYTLLFVVASAALRLIPRLRKKNSM